MITIAVASSKGGTGKTTLSAALAVRAAKDGKRVAMADLDPQKSLVQWWRRRGGTDNPRIFNGHHGEFHTVIFPKPESR
jgi:chromosome partitioning protein